MQKTQAQENPKSASSKYNPQEDTIGTAHNHLSHSGASQSSGNRNPREGENVRPAISSTMGSSVAGKRYNTSKVSESVRSTDRYSQLDVAEPSAKQEWTSSTNKQSGKEEATVVINYLKVPSNSIIINNLVLSHQSEVNFKEFYELTMKNYTM